MADDLFTRSVALTSRRHRDQIMLTGGMKILLEELKKVGSNLPGMKLAIAVAEGVMAKEQISLSGWAYREAAKAGCDLTRVSAIYTQPVKGSDDEFELLVETEGAPE